MVQTKNQAAKPPALKLTKRQSLKIKSLKRKKMRSKVTKIAQKK